MAAAAATALPLVKSLADCASFSQTVVAYLDELLGLPGQLLKFYNQPEQLKALYLNTNPLVTAFALCLALVPFFFVLAEVNRNYSQVDRAWSILPTVYNAHYSLYAHLTGSSTTKLDTLLAFSAIWSIRLTFNYWRKGGYSIGSEDYRWNIVKKTMSPRMFVLLDFGFIALAQNVLLFLITTPTYVIFLSTRIVEKFTVADLVFSRLLATLILLEFFADQQQWNFQQAKKQYQATARPPAGFLHDDLDRGFVVSGLWAWTRHPNFAAEQAIWLTLYQWGCWNSDSLFNWTGIGALCYVLLFQASTNLTEKISRRKYPEYKEYQARVGKFIPRLGIEAKASFTDPKTKANNEDKKKR